MISVGSSWPMAMGLLKIMANLILEILPYRSFCVVEMVAEWWSLVDVAGGVQWLFLWLSLK